MPADSFVVIAVAVLAGAVVQGSIGLGLGLIAAPVVALVAPALLPGTLLWLAVILPVFTLFRERRDIDWWGLRWAFLGRLPATALCAWVVSIISARVLGLIVGVVILLAVALTARSIRLPMRRPVLIGAGIVSGVSGTITSIGGPPLALVYQREAGPLVRPTLAVYFVVGAAASLAALGVAGEVSIRQTVAALALLPVLAAGFGLSLLLRKRIDGRLLRIAVLAVSAASATALLVRLG